MASDNLAWRRAFLPVDHHAVGLGPNPALALFVQQHPGTVLADCCCDPLMGNRTHATQTNQSVLLCGQNKVLKSNSQTQHLEQISVLVPWHLHQESNALFDLFEVFEETLQWGS
eukprot:TRINITY_DN67410_c0_g1_i1.p1 TRINITY_DN67410_c0_g1~~TRINITY_DN67410_c0_g1_i1.p1  ORF type:complete len:114 (+),score=2.17 TRINITY_DN67410_c0_g1_i1:255-596(+)